MPVSSIQYGQVPWYYTNGFTIKNSVGTPNTRLTVSTGSVLDSTGSFQIVLSSDVIVDLATTGLNGLDTGTLAASTVYYIMAVGDPVTQQATGVVVTLAYAAPLLPFGYSVFALLGAVTTDSSAHILKGYWTAYQSNIRLFMYDVPQSTAVVAGNATSYTSVNLSSLITAFNADTDTDVIFDLPVIINTTYTPATAGNILSLQPGNGTGALTQVIGQVAAVPIYTQSLMLKSDAAGVPTIKYKVGNSGDSVLIQVSGYWLFV